MMFVSDLPLPFCKFYNLPFLCLCTGATNFGDLIYTLVIWYV